MKSAYELAMERLNTEDPDSVVKLTDSQKKELADIDSKWTAKIAEREVFLQKQLQDAQSKHEMEEVGLIMEQLKQEKIRLTEEMEDEKNKVRNSSGNNSQ